MPNPDYDLAAITTLWIRIGVSSIALIKVNISYSLMHGIEIASEKMRIRRRQNSRRTTRTRY